MQKEEGKGGKLQLVPLEEIKEPQQEKPAAAGSDSEGASPQPAAAKEKKAGGEGGTTPKERPTTKEQAEEVTFEPKSEVVEAVGSAEKTETEAAGSNKAAQVEERKRESSQETVKADKVGRRPRGGERFSRARVGRHVSAEIPPLVIPRFPQLPQRRLSSR